ncbi:MAG: hypothetical protein EOO51_10670 [Flavobacterium sp.]|nr:MAG: hypothetical protein EOO51_10670 [Flavobacterium sp.]
MKSKFLLLIVAFTVFACKEEKKPEAAEPQKEEVSQTMVVTLNATVKKDDSFHLFYTEDNSINFDEKQSMWVEFKGSDSAQDIVFKLPEDVLPTNFRLDFGLNKDQEDIVVNNFRVDYLGKTIDAKGPEFFTYFYPNEQCTKVDITKSLVMPIKKGADYIGPMFYPQTVLNTKLSELVKG